MELNKDELRVKIEDYLKNVLDGQRVHIDKNILESLLFSTTDFFEDRECQNIIGGGKVIVWSGKFLSKIDLSEISFDDVVWNNSNIYTTDLEYVDGMEGVIFKEVDLSNTNARIDFSKSFDAKHPREYSVGGVLVESKKQVIISHINLSGVDLSKSNFECVRMVIDSNLDFTNVPLVKEDSLEEIVLRGVSLKGIDLSNATVNATNLYAGLKDSGIIFNCEERKYIQDNLEQSERFINYYAEDCKELDENDVHLKCIEISDCDIENTGLNVVYDKTDEVVESILHPDFNVKLNLSNAIKSGKLAGCTINGEKISSLQIDDNQDFKRK